MEPVKKSNTLQPCRGAVSGREAVPLHTAGSSCAPVSFVSWAGKLYTRTIGPYKAKYRAVWRQAFSAALVVETRVAFLNPAATAFSSWATASSFFEVSKPRQTV